MKKYTSEECIYIMLWILNNYWAMRCKFFWYSQVERRRLQLQRDQIIALWLDIFENELMENNHEWTCERELHAWKNFAQWYEEWKTCLIDIMEDTTPEDKKLCHKTLPDFQ